MATIKKFEDLECWKLARQLTNEVKSMLYLLQDFNYTDKRSLEELMKLTNHTQSKILDLIRYLKSKQP